MPGFFERLALKAAEAAEKSAKSPPAAQGKGGKTYPVSLVGERSYQTAIKRCRVGDPAGVFHEPGNPYDDCAIAVASAAGETLGYIPRDCWLRDALLAEGKGCTAEIDHIGSDGGPLGVRIRVTLTDGPIREREFRRT